MDLSSLQRQLRNKRFMQPIRMKRLARKANGDGHFDWASILTSSPQKWNSAKFEAKGPKVLIATNVALHFGATRIDSLLGIALTLRGAQVEFLLCDTALPACMSADTSWFSNDHSRFEAEGMTKYHCQQCFDPAEKKLQNLGLKIHRFSSYITPEDKTNTEEWLTLQDLSKPSTIVEDGIALGEQAVSGTLRYLARGTINTRHWPVLRAYLRAARLTKIAVERLNAEQKYDVALLHHGIYVPQGTAAAALKNQGVRIVTWFPTYRKKCFIFAHDDTYHRTMLTEPISVWEDIKFGDKQIATIQKYLKSRWTGSQDWISFHTKPEFDFDKFAKTRALDPNKPLIGLLTNVFWDAQLHYPESSFSSMREWLVQTVQYFGGRDDLQLIIRVHPAEVTGAMPACETAISILSEGFDPLPDNVFVVGPEETISTYSIAAKCAACIIYATKAGIELASMGIPVIAAGEAWVKGKFLAVDANSHEDYFAHLQNLPQITPPANFKARALKYAYHFFFRRMIPLQVIKHVNSWPPYNIDVQNVSQLDPRMDSGLDVICEGILNAQPFIFPAENIDK